MVREKREGGIDEALLSSLCLPFPPFPSPHPSPPTLNEFFLPSSLTPRFYLLPTPALSAVASDQALARAHAHPRRLRRRLRYPVAAGSLRGVTTARAQLRLTRGAEGARRQSRPGQYR